MSRGGGHSVAKPELSQLNQDIWLISLASQMTKDRQHDLTYAKFNQHNTRNRRPLKIGGVSRASAQGRKTGSGGWGNNGRGVSNEYL